MSSGPWKNSFWTPDRDEEMLQMRSDNYSASEIAKAIGSTRGAVLGRIDRLRKAGKLKVGKNPKHKNTEYTPEIDQLIRDLGPRGKCASQISAKAGISSYLIHKRAAELKIKLASGRIERAPEKMINNTKEAADNKPSKGLMGSVALFAGAGISWIMHRDGMCHWPFDGKAADGNPRCCGEPIASEAARYCALHDQIAFRYTPNMNHTVKGID